MKVLILGGYGVFGGRLVRLLQDVEGLRIVVSGRSLEHARAFCLPLRGKTHLEPLALDRANISEAVRVQRPNLVVDASGPFQDYGANTTLALWRRAVEVFSGSAGIGLVVWAGRTGG